jgi:ribosomal protein S18 acetylase RimI-like enzyme
MTITLISAHDLPFDDFVHTFNRAYSDYFVPVYIEGDAMRRTIRRDAIHLKQSWVALHHQRPIGIGMLGLRNGLAWIGGLGVVPEWRGQGIGRQLTLALLESARHAKASHLQLEVIERNQAAFQLYQSLGFEVKRRLLVLQAPPEAITPAPDPTYRLQEVSVRVALKHYKAFHAQSNPWQRSYEALDHLTDSMDAWTISQGGAVRAYAVGWLTDEMIRLMDVAMQPDQQAALTALLRHLHQQAPHVPGSLVNLPDSDPTWPVLKQLGYQPVESQWEMVLPLA